MTNSNDILPFDPANPRIYLAKNTWVKGYVGDVLETIDWWVLLNCFPKNIKQKVDIFIQMKALRGPSGSTWKHITNPNYKTQIWLANDLVNNPHFVYIIHNLCHEFTHALCKWKSYWRWGFQEFVDGLDLRGINEWITELISDEVLNEYLKRVWLSKFIHSKPGTNPLIIPYRYYRIRAKQLVQNISILAWVSYQVAWEAVRSSYFESEDLTWILLKDFWLPIEEIRRLTMNAWMFSEVVSLVKYILNPPLS